MKQALLILICIKRAHHLTHATFNQINASITSRYIIHVKERSYFQEMGILKNRIKPTLSLHHVDNILLSIVKKYVIRHKIHLKEGSQITRLIV